MSAIGAITLAPRRRRIGLYWTLLDHNICAEDVVNFVRHVRRHLRRKIVLILDRWSVHTATIVAHYVQRHCHSIHVEWLPAYAPDLNPLEQVWNHSKYADLANLAPDDLEELDSLVNSSINDTRGQSSLLRSFFKMAGLSL